MATQVILLERIEKLGAMGDIVNVKPGYARNFLLPQNKALRATESNIAYFETQKATLEKANEEKKKAAEKHAQSLKGLKVALIRQAGESGQLYGSVTARDIAEVINENVEQKIDRNMIDLNQNYKEIGLFDVIVTLHPEVKETVTINIARTEDEAKEQAKTGKALIAETQEEATAKAQSQAEEQDNRKEFMEEDAYKAEKEAEEKEAAEKAEADAKAAEKAEAKAAKKAEAVEEDSTEGEAETAKAASEDVPEETKEEGRRN